MIFLVNIFILLFIFLSWSECWSNLVGFDFDIESLSLKDKDSSEYVVYLEH